MNAPPAPRFNVDVIDVFERDVVLRMPFRFGVVAAPDRNRPRPPMPNRRREA